MGSVEKYETLDNGVVEKNLLNGISKPLSAKAQTHKGLRTGTTLKIVNRFWYNSEKLFNTVFFVAY